MQVQARIELDMGLDKLDLAIIAIYLVGITLFGLRFRKKQRSLRDYFLADRNIPWWAICLSIVAAETSTLTIISTPGLAYDTNLMFLQLVLGYAWAASSSALSCCRTIFAAIFLPRMNLSNAASASGFARSLRACFWSRVPQRKVSACMRFPLLWPSPSGRAKSRPLPSSLFLL